LVPQPVPSTTGRSTTGPINQQNNGPLPVSINISYYSQISPLDFVISMCKLI
jgi:hypothetical protein